MNIGRYLRGEDHHIGTARIVKTDRPFTSKPEERLRVREVLRCSDCLMIRLAFLILFLTLSACGGGGDDSPDPQEDEIPIEASPDFVGPPLTFDDAHCTCVPI